MSFDARFRSLFSRSTRVWLLAVCLGLLMTGGPAFGVAGNGSPAVAVPGGSTPPSPNDRWNASSSVKPAAILEDFTWFVGHSDPVNGNTRQFYALDIENGFLFAATGQGLEIIDVRNGPTRAAVASYIFGSHNGGSFPGWVFPGDEDWFVKTVDAPAGNSGIVALGMEGEGFAIVRTTSPEAPVVAYVGKHYAAQVYSVRAAGRDWTYALDDAGLVYRFDLTAAASLSGCHETPPATVCPGVYKGLVNPIGGPWNAMHGTGNFLATGSKFASTGKVKIWSLTDPGVPALALQINAPAVALAMWQSGSSIYLARIDNARRLAIHNVSCLASGSCSSAPEVWSSTLSSPSPLGYVTVSQDGSKTYLYVGGSDSGTCAVQREFIFDATSPTAPVELTPKIHAGGYWGWYYQDCATGFNLIGPRMAKVYNHTLYRAANNLLDAHSIGSLDNPPVANFTWSPSEIYPGTTVTFTDQSSGSPTQWTWTFEEGTPSVSSAQNPQVDFPTTIAPGPKTVTLEAVNPFGPDSTSQVLTVRDPSPQLTGVNVSPAAAIVCQPVTMTAVNPGGKPPLQYQWKVKNSAGAEVFSQTNANQSQQWDTGSATADSYTAELTLSGTGTPVTRTKAFTLGALPSLPLGDQFTPTIDPFTAGTVTFHVVASGATAWNWDFDGDGVFNESDWTDDPVAGPNPTHSYSTTGTRQVRVKVRNCQNLIGVISAPVSVDITQITPLKALFAANTLCSGGICFVTAGQAVPFVDLSTGADRWDYDWNGDGSFEDADNTGPRLSHTFATTGTFTPRLRVRRGESEENIFILDSQIDVSPAAPGSITVGGPSSGQTNASLTFTASASGSCSPSANGWSWSLAGGSATGSVTGSSVTVTWASAGNKVVSASNSACSGVSGSKSVTITGGSNNGPTITIGGPSSGQPNASLTFTASGSGGCNPNANGWSWSLSGGSATGGVTDSSVTVSWESAGTKVISASNSACSGVSGSKSVTITSGSNNSTLKADFTVSPAVPVAGQAVSFNGAISQGSPEAYTWVFNDGTALGSGAQISHTFAQPGSYRVELSVSKASTQCAPSPFCENTLVKTVVVTSGAPPLAAAFNSDICNNPLGICTTDSGKLATFTDSSTGNIVSRVWDFGDGETATGTTVTHTYKRAGTYQLTLTVSDGTKSNVFARTVLVNGVLTEDMLLPWIGKTAAGTQVQSSDIYLHNPSATESIDVTLEFRQRGLSVANPPKVTRTIAANATLFVSDALKTLFGLDNMTGFLAVKIDRGSVQPVLMSFNTTYRKGVGFSQTVPGLLQSATGAAASTGNKQVQHLVGLNDNEERLAYFGFSNAGSTKATYTLRFFDNQGRAIGTSKTFSLSPKGAKQFQAKEIRSLFGLTDQDDYRVEIESARNTELFPYGTNVRIGSADPSFISAGGSAARVYLLGALSTKGAKNSVWRSDLLLANTGSEVVIADITYTNVGVTSQPTDVIHETLQPGETRRLADVIGTKWNIRNGVGVLTIDSDAPGDQFPVVQGESYENTKPAKRYGQTLPALTEAQAAGPGQGQFLVGLQQDAKNRTTFWMFNPGTSTGQYDVVFRNLGGSEIGRLSNVALGAGKLRQLNQAQFPAGVSGGFTVQIIVKQGKMLAAAQVVTNGTNDPSYVQGETR